MGPKKKKTLGHDAGAESPTTSSASTPKLKDGDEAGTKLVQKLNPCSTNIAESPVQTNITQNQFQIFLSTLNNIKSSLKDIHSNQENIMKTQLEMKNQFVSFGNRITAMEKETTTQKDKMGKEIKKLGISSQTEINNTIGLKQNMETVIAKLDNVILEVGEQKENINEKIKTYADTVSCDVQREVAALNPLKEISYLNKNVEQLKTNMETKFNQDQELKDRASREKNVCLYNIPESDSNDPEQAYKDDIGKLKAVLNNKVIIKKEDIKAVYRAGPKDSKKQASSRPLIMKLATKEKRLEILQLRGLEYVKEDPEINESPDKTHQPTDEHTKTDDATDKSTVTINCSNTIKVYTSPDRTITQQKAHKELVTLLKERKKNGEKNIHIKNGKILTFVPFRGNPQSYWG